MNVIKLRDDVVLMKDVEKFSVSVLHATDSVPAIKKIVTAHDIISLNLLIESRFKPYEGFPPWDLSSIKELNHIRIDLLVFHHADFRPYRRVLEWSEKMKQLFRTILLNAPDLALPLDH